MPVTAKQWELGMWKENMTETEKTAYDTAKAERHSKAIAKVSAGDFPAGVRFKLGDHTLTAHPQGVSEKGGVSYSASPSTIQIGKYHVRINKVSFTVLADKGETVIEGDMI
jgi:hypothetical protein